MLYHTQLSLLTNINWPVQPVISGKLSQIKDFYCTKINRLNSRVSFESCHCNNLLYYYKLFDSMISLKARRDIRWAPFKLRVDPSKCEYEMSSMLTLELIWNDQGTNMQICKQMITLIAWPDMLHITCNKLKLDFAISKLVTFRIMRNIIGLVLLFYMKPLNL